MSRTVTEVPIDQEMELLKARVARDRANAEFEKVIIKVYRSGVPIKRIAEILGLSRQTVYNMIERN